MVLKVTDNQLSVILLTAGLLVFIFVVVVIGSVCAWLHRSRVG